MLKLASWNVNGLRAVNRKGEFLPFLKKYKPEVYPAFVSKIKNNYIMNTLIRVRSDMWPDPALSAILYSLPPSFTVKVDPESIL